MPQSDADQCSATSSFELTHAGIASRYRVLISGTLLLLGVENLLMLISPYLLGRAIDGMVAGTLQGLWLFLVVSLAALVLGVARRCYDTRAYGRVYREAAAQTMTRELDAEAPVSRMTARAQFVADFAAFFEYALPAALSSVVALFGAAGMLLLISPSLGVAALVAGALVAAVFYRSKKQIADLNASMNDQLEYQVDALESREMSQIDGHFSALVRWQIRLSDLEARNFGLSFLVMIALTAVALYVLIMVQQQTVGQAFAALTYVLQFSDAAIMLPLTYQEFIRTLEISRRLREEGG